MMKTTLQVQDADTFYEQLLDAHEGLDADASALLNARLILLLAEMGVMVNIGRNGERARLEREEAHAERERQRKAKTIVLDTARRAQTEQ